MSNAFILKFIGSGTIIVLAIILIAIGVGTYKENFKFLSFTATLAGFWAIVVAIVIFLY